MQVATPIATETPWLEYFPTGSGEMKKHEMATCPVAIGRCESCEVTIDSGRVSRRHAVIERVDGQFLLKDLQSTNGTFVNGQQIGEQVVQDGDMIRIGDIELSFHQRAADSERNGPTQVMTIPQENSREASRSMIRAIRRTKQAIVCGGQRSVLSRILHLETKQLMAQWVGGVEKSFPAETSHGEKSLLRIECRTMTRFRQQLRLSSVEEAKYTPDVPIIVQIETSEIDHETAIEDLLWLGRCAGKSRELVVAIPDRAVSDDSHFRKFIESLASKNIAIAFHGFVGGVPQLRERAELRPKFVTLAPTFASEHDFDEQRLRQLVEISEESQCKLVATSVDTEQQALQCLNAGCLFGEGEYAAATNNSSAETH